MTAGFVAYIDESGDPGLRRVFPRTAGGASEWFVLSCVLVQIARDGELIRWVRDAVAATGTTQRQFLHFRDLTPAKKEMVCNIIAGQPLRCFVAMSNKKNMEGHRNPRPFHEPNWFYQWMTRILLERVTEFRAAVTDQLYGETRTVRIVFSRRGGLRMHRLQGYLRLMKFQSEIGHLYIKTKDIKWSVIDLNDIHILDHKARAGLQFADAVASAFYQSVCLDRGPCDPQFAKLLQPRVHRNAKGVFIEHGIKPFPQPHTMKLLPPQREIFEFYGFPKGGW